MCISILDPGAARAAVEGGKTPRRLPSCSREVMQLHSKPWIGQGCSLREREVRGKPGKGRISKVQHIFACHSPTLEILKLY